MNNMDGGTLLRFTGTCKTFMKLGDDHPELFRRIIIKNYGTKYAKSVPRESLRNETLAIVKRDPNDPVVRRHAMEKEEEERMKEEAMKGKLKTKVGSRYVAKPDFTPRYAKRYFWSSKGYWWNNPFVDKLIYVNGVPTTVRIREVDPSHERLNYIPSFYVWYH